MSMIEAQLRDLENLREKITLAARNDFVHMDSKDADIVRDAIDTIQAQSAKLVAKNFRGGWIKCEEWLPKKGEIVVICDKFNNIHIAIYHRFSDGSMMFCADIPYMISNVTYWMELPELPESRGAG